MIEPEIGTPRLELLYRGSRDGFGATKFHNKCDYHSRTITIIKTTKEFVFGGYASVNWSSNGGYTKDPDAFLFSLVNRFNQPFISNVDYSSKAVFCDAENGPAFGDGYDIYICDNSNRSTKSFTEFPQSYQKSDDLDASDDFYFCDESSYFQVKEIEVFQVQNKDN